MTNHELERRNSLVRLLIDETSRIHASLAIVKGTRFRYYKMKLERSWNKCALFSGKMLIVSSVAFGRFVKVLPILILLDCDILCREDW